MGRLSKAQITRREACRQGGRGRKKLRISESPLPINTPKRPKTTAWRYKQKAAVAEHALHTAALAKIKASISSRPSTGYMSLVDSRPATPDNGFGSQPRNIAMNSVCSTSIEYGSIVAMCESVANSPDISISELDSGGSVDNAARQLRTENREDFEDIDEIELILDPLLPTGSIEHGEFTNAVKSWPRVHSLELKREILEKGNFFYAS